MAQLERNAPPPPVTGLCPSLRYAVRRGRSSPGLTRALLELVPAYEVRASAPVDWGEIFGRSAPLAVEIGAGSGEHLVAHAKRFPEMDHVAIEFYPPGVAQLARALDSEMIRNVRLIREPARDALELAFADGAIALAFALFPDPWPKRRHRKRRLVSREFVALLARKMRLGGTLGFASDCAEYAAAARMQLEGSGMFAPVEPWPERVAPSKYELRARRLGARIVGFKCRRAGPGFSGAKGAS